MSKLTPQIYAFVLDFTSFIRVYKLFVGVSALDHAHRYVD
jgi:hypothetical protein